VRIIRTQSTGGWTPIANAALQDHRISWRAKGLLAELLSYRDGWETTVDKLVATARLSGDASEGFRAMRNAMAELAKAGYVRYRRTNDVDGKWHTEVEIRDCPTDASRTDTSETDTSARPADMSPTSTDVSGTDTSVYRHVGNRHVPRKNERAPHPSPLRGTADDAKRDDPVERALALLETHSLADAAKMCGIPLKTLIRAASRPIPPTPPRVAIGGTRDTEIDPATLERAFALMRAGTHGISEAAAECGISARKLMRALPPEGL